MNPAGIQRKRGGGLLSTATRVSEENQGIEHPHTTTVDVNTGGALAWEDGHPTAPVPFDWSAVEGGAEPALTSGAVDRYPELLALLREVVSTADGSGAVPSVRQVAVSFMGLCAVLRMDFIQDVSLRKCAAELGVSHETFNRRVQRWCALLGTTAPAAKPAGTGRKIALALESRARRRDAA
jgi:hypothetical protein